MLPMGGEIPQLKPVNMNRPRLAPPGLFLFGPSDKGYLIFFIHFKTNQSRMDNQMKVLIH